MPKKKKKPSRWVKDFQKEYAQLKRENPSAAKKDIFGFAAYTADAKERKRKRR